MSGVLVWTDFVRVFQTHVLPEQAQEHEHKLNSILAPQLTALACIRKHMLSFECTRHDIDIEDCCSASPQLLV